MLVFMILSQSWPAAPPQPCLKFIPRISWRYLHLCFFAPVQLLIIRIDRIANKSGDTLCQHLRQHNLYIADPCSEETLLSLPKDPEYYDCISVVPTTVPEPFLPLPIQVPQRFNIKKSLSSSSVSANLNQMTDTHLSYQCGPFLALQEASPSLKCYPFSADGNALIPIFLETVKITQVETSGRDHRLNRIGLSVASLAQSAAVLRSHHGTAFCQSRRLGEHTPHCCRPLNHLPSTSPTYTRCLSIRPAQIPTPISAPTTMSQVVNAIIRTTHPRTPPSRLETSECRHFSSTLRFNFHENG
ncbi:hypothetical protein EDC04DRAFT_840499 [Pisolithus marmoratus]|nr:hypothetical protein EDC04DRAFT_840499 [Pisolithus marmoratus]